NENAGCRLCDIGMRDATVDPVDQPRQAPSGFMDGQGELLVELPNEADGHATLLDVDLPRLGILVNNEPLDETLHRAFGKVPRQVKEVVRPEQFEFALPINP